MLKKCVLWRVLLRPPKPSQHKSFSKGFHGSSGASRFPFTKTFRHAKKTFKGAFFFVYSFFINTITVRGVWGQKPRHERLYFNFVLSHGACPPSVSPKCLYNPSIVTLHICAYDWLVHVPHSVGSARALMLLLIQYFHSDSGDMYFWRNFMHLGEKETLRNGGPVFRYATCWSSISGSKVMHRLFYQSVPAPPKCWVQTMRSQLYHLHVNLQLSPLFRKWPVSM